MDLFNARNMEHFVTPIGFILRFLQLFYIDRISCYKTLGLWSKECPEHVCEE